MSISVKVGQLWQDKNGTPPRTFRVTKINRSVVQVQGMITDMLQTFEAGRKSLEQPTYSLSEMNS